jgi:hypothetical protein
MTDRGVLILWERTMLTTEFRIRIRMSNLDQSKISKNTNIGPECEENHALVTDGWNRIRIRIRPPILDWRSGSGSMFQSFNPNTEQHFWKV